MTKQFGKMSRSAHYNAEGIGLGFHICQKLVEQFGGSLLVKSEGEDKGCTVSFSMCMADVT